MATAQEVLDTAAQLGWLEPPQAPKGTFGYRCETCGEHSATKVCLVCLAAETGAMITGDARGTVVIMPTAVRGYPY